MVIEIDEQFKECTVKTSTVSVQHLHASLATALHLTSKVALGLHPDGPPKKSCIEESDTL